jgi:GNAT superfamily N-acetyltransferase
MDIQCIQTDLAPGDLRAREFDWKALEVVLIRSAHHPLFHDAYQFLWNEFGASNEIEQKEVIVRRLGRDPRTIIQGYTLLYEMIAVHDAQGLAAVRDHTAIVPRAEPSQPAVVHLSHLLVVPHWRGTGLTAWMRAWPIQTAQRCLEIYALDPHRLINLVAEMEHPDPHNSATIMRLKSYQRAGFVKVDPSVVTYHQPDFRPPAEIDAAGGPLPLPFALILRRVGREAETSISGAELRAAVHALYTMYSLEFREKDMRALFEQLDSSYPTQDVPLVEPLKMW